MNICANKKVVLWETARGVSPTSLPVQVPASPGWGWGTPSIARWRVHPASLGQGVSVSSLCWEYPIQDASSPGWCTPLDRDLGPVELLWDTDGVHHRKDMKPVELLWDGGGVPPGKDMEPVKVEVLWSGNGVTPPPPPPNRHTPAKHYLPLYYVRG